MRLWHEKLIPYLPRQQLLGQHRECCALRGNDWGRKHATVDYVFKHDPMHLVAYHLRVIVEMRNRGYKVCMDWTMPSYRGKHHDVWPIDDIDREVCFDRYLEGDPIYPEHNDEYLKECFNNLERKGIHIEMRDQHAD